MVQRGWAGWDSDLGHLALGLCPEYINKSLLSREEAGPCGRRWQKSLIECCRHQFHLQFKTTSSRKHNSHYSLSPKQLQSCPTCPHNQPSPTSSLPSSGCLTDMDSDKWGQKTPVTGHSVLPAGSLAHKFSTKNSPHCKDCPWEAGGGAGGDCCVLVSRLPVWSQHEDSGSSEKQHLGEHRREEEI